MLVGKCLKLREIGDGTIYKTTKNKKRPKTKKVMQNVKIAKIVKIEQFVIIEKIVTNVIFVKIVRNTMNIVINSIFILIGLDNVQQKMEKGHLLYMVKTKKKLPIRKIKFRVIFKQENILVKVMPLYI